MMMKNSCFCCCYLRVILLYATRFGCAIQRMSIEEAKFYATMNEGILSTEKSSRFLILITNRFPGATPSDKKNLVTHPISQS